FWLSAVAVRSPFESEVRAFWLSAVAGTFSFENEGKPFCLSAVEGFYWSNPNVYTRTRLSRDL
ncbi:MAG: hypothetical protein V5A43_07595, partial [Haloarculaceae archaeon]